MQIQSTAPNVTTGAVTSNPSAPITLPYERRHDRLSYQNADGTVGCAAFPINYDEVYNLKGRLLTLIDATFTDPQQRKAQKDVVWQAVKAWFDDIQRAAGCDEFGHSIVYALDNGDEVPPSFGSTPMEGAPDAP